jgi:hypothetical protein
MMKPYCISRRWDGLAVGECFQKCAIDELLTLPKHHPYRTSTLRLEQGIEQGREATQQAIALKMLQEGMNRETVARLTGLTLTQLPQST